MECTLVEKKKKKKENLKIHCPQKKKKKKKKKTHASVAKTEIFKREGTKLKEQNSKTNLHEYDSG